MITLFDRAWDILIENRYAYFLLNVLYYGLIILFMAYAVFDAPLQNRILETSGANYMTGALSLVNQTFDARTLLLVLGRTFLINVLGTNYGSITLPSFVIPFAGIFQGLFQAVMLGLIFSPFNTAIGPIFAPHIPTLFIEGQACVLAMLGAYIQGRAMLWPKSMGQVSRWKAYVEGVRQTGTIYMFIMALLLISAIYGVIEAAWLMG
jgi:hypothetical protein